MNDYPTMGGEAEPFAAQMMRPTVDEGDVESRLAALHQTDIAQAIALDDIEKQTQRLSAEDESLKQLFATLTGSVGDLSLIHI